MSQIKKHAVVTLEIEDLAYGGLGVAKPEGFVVFVKHGVPGDRVKARIEKKSRNHAHATIQEIERPSPRRIEAPCPHFGPCGGCSWQHLSYEDQLQWKQKQVGETLEHLGSLTGLPEISPILASPEIWHYRNKMEFTFGTGEDGLPIVGFHLPGRFDRVFGVHQCLIHPEPFDALLAELTAWAREERLTSYNQRTHEGFLRHAVIRHSKTTDAIILMLITACGELREPQALVERLKARCPRLQGFVWGINRRVADVATIESERHRWGELTLTERVNGLDFSISPEAFFQTNTLAAQRLYRVVTKLADLDAHDRVLDAYCGAGAIGLHAALRGARVVGIDSSRASIWDARANAKANDLPRATFLVGPMSETLRLARSAVGSFTCVIIDPPRGGMDKKSLSRLIALAAPTFLYVSCNPATLARDLQTLIEAEYEIDAVQPIDMFPHTYHIEVVVRLRKNRSAAKR